MERAICRAIFNVYARRISVSPPLQTLRSGSLPARFSVLTSFQSRCYSSGNEKYSGLDSTTNQNKDSLVDDAVSNEELKKKIDKFYEGDVDSLPTIFEAILKRKLSGKYEDADHELMKEIRQQMPGEVEDLKDEEYDSDSDKEMEDFSDASESEEEDRRL